MHNPPTFYIGGREGNIVERKKFLPLSTDEEKTHSETATHKLPTSDTMKPSDEEISKRSKQPEKR